MATVQKNVLSQVRSPDFYWKFRLDRLERKVGGDLPFKQENYPNAKGYKEYFEAYYLDLTVSGKTKGFDWISDKHVSDEEWLTIYESIAEWSQKVAAENKISADSLPESDFDFLQQLYPSVSTADIEVPFTVEEVGPNFPYNNLKSMFEAASQGTLKVPGYSADSVTSLDCSDAIKKLENLHAEMNTKLDAIYADCMAFATSPFPDDAAKKHYQQLKVKLAEFPQSPAEWKTYRENFDKEVDEMARLASKKEEHHAHHDDDHHEDRPSVAKEFEDKYGRNLEEMQERYLQFKADPVAFYEKSVEATYGKRGVDVWRRAQEVSEKIKVLSESEKKAVEDKFAEFLKQA